MLLHNKETIQLHTRVEILRPYYYFSKKLKACQKKARIKRKPVPFVEAVADLTDMYAAGEFLEAGQGVGRQPLGFGESSEVLCAEFGPFAL